MPLSLDTLCLYIQYYLVILDVGSVRNRGKESTGYFSLVLLTL